MVRAPNIPYLGREWSFSIHFIFGQMTATSGFQGMPRKPYVLTWLGFLYHLLIAGYAP